MVERKLITTKDSEGKDLVLIVNKPNAKILRDAQITASLAFSEALKSKALLRAKLDEYMKEQGLWDEAKEKEIVNIAKRINDGIRKLARGAAGGFTKTQARELALQIGKDRSKQSELMAGRRELDAYTVEGQSENARFDYLVSVCVTNEDTRPTYNSLEDYRERAAEPYSMEAAATLANMMYKFDEDFDSKLPENKFLKEHGFVDDKFRLINKDGHLISEDGKLINDKGRYVNEEGKFVDVNGNLIDEAGNPVEEFIPFKD
jgi:hypothetical protein